MVALFLMNYLNDISCFTSFDLLIKNSFLCILLPVLVYVYMFSVVFVHCCSGLPLITDSFLRLKGLP